MYRKSQGPIELTHDENEAEVPVQLKRAVSTAFWVLDDSFFDAPQLKCLRLPEQGTLALSMQPLLTLEGLDSQLFVRLKTGNERLHYTSTLCKFLYSSVLVLNAIAIMYALGDTGCEHLVKYVLPRECYFVLLYFFCFVLIRVGVLKTYVLQPMIGLFRMYEPTWLEVVTLVVFGTSLIIFGIHVAVLHAAVSLGSYNAAITLTLSGLIAVLVALTAFGTHVRTFTQRADHPELTVPDQSILDPSFLVNATSLAHIVDYTSNLDQERVDVLHGLSILTENNQSAMLTVNCLTMVLNVYGILYSLEHLPDSCEADPIRHDVQRIIRVQAVFMPTLAAAYAVLRVFLIKAQVARPVASCFNLKKSSDYSGLIMSILFIFIVGSYVWVLYVLTYEPVDYVTYWATSFSLFASLCSGMVILVYSWHCNGLIQKVMATFQHSVNTRKIGV